jgi:methylmalonyl-CoA/ethylmalonyl-CoA epimerase
MFSTVPVRLSGHNRFEAASDIPVSTTRAGGKQSVPMSPPVSTSGATIAGTAFDHVAHAVVRWQDVWTRYAVDLGAEWSSGGPGPGFAPAQLRFGNGARVEVLMPHRVEVNDFLDRFITGNGPGPHHLTFKVPDLQAALERVVEAGFDPIGVDVSDPEWMEAFIHPKRATGVVVQLAEQRIPWASPPPDDYPTERRRRPDGSGPAPPASLRWVAHVVADLEAASGLFVGLLGGSVVDEGMLPDQRWVDLQWAGPLGLRLIAPTDGATGPLNAWLGGRSGRIHHLELTVEDPAGVPGIRPAGSPLALMGRRGTPVDLWELAPEDNSGLGLVLAPA